MRWYRLALFTCAIGVGIVGHFGGTLTYGSDYYTAIFHPTAQPSPTVAPKPVETEPDTTQVLMFGTAQEMRDTRIAASARQDSRPTRAAAGGCTDEQSDRSIHRREVASRQVGFGQESAAGV